MQVTDSHCIVGTPGYMAPEVIGRQGATSKSDIYALGAILYEMIASEPPFTGDITELLTGHAYAEPAPPSEDHPLSALSMRMLAKSPDDRPSIPEILAALKVASHSSPPTQPEVQPERERAWGPALLGLGLVAALLAAGIGTYLVLGR